MKSLITGLVMGMFSSIALAGTWVVDDDGKANFDNIQDAITAAYDGDIVIVSPGTYTSTQDGHVVNMLGKAITLRSSNPENPSIVAATIINGEGQRRAIACFNGETSDTVIDGFTITGGFASDYDYNGDKEVGSNESNCGGGIYNFGSSPTIQNCMISNNLAQAISSQSGGGGIYNYESNATIQSCRFIENEGGFGGAIHNLNASDVTISDCEFDGNSASTNNLQSGGGAIRNESSTPSISNCTFSENYASVGGGGILNSDSSCSINYCQFNDNLASSGGAMYNWNQSNPLISSTTICNNSAEQIYGEWTDNGNNTIEDTCEECSADINEDGTAGLNDLLILIGNWGSTTSLGDINTDGVVDIVDLLLIIDNWGSCE
ncbi:MAG: hypothetical protein ISR75_06500 [Phycisphaerales bacterium]|nr:hypothetical protein [Planctomycetota bacterium]MBL6998068.1 hypothetical protein [Phycisphaerales bacterium]